MKLAHENTTEASNHFFGKQLWQQPEREGSAKALPSSWLKHSYIFELLFSHDADLIRRVQCTKPSTLYVACTFGVTEIVKLLLQLGMDVGDLYRTDNSGLSYWSSFITIVSSGSLLSAVASSHDLTDLLCQVDWSQTEEILSILLDKGLDVNYKDRSGSFALGIASSEGHTKLVEYLLRSGQAKVNQQDEEGVSSLMQATAGGFTKICHLLLSHRAKLDLQDKKGWSALMFAVAGGYMGLVVDFLGKGSQANLQDECGTSPLMLSSFTGHIHITKVLLAYDADPNLQNNEGITALMMGSYNGHMDVVELLIRHGADMEAQTCIGKTALQFSSNKDHHEVTKLLVEYGARQKRSSALGKRKPCVRDSYTVMNENSISYGISSTQLEERLDRMEQILQTLLQHQVSNSAVASPAEKHAKMISAKPTLRETCALLTSIAYDWHNIGIQLNLENDSLKGIRYDCQGVAKDCLREMLSQWLNRAIPPPTWQELAEALEIVDHQGIARKITRV